MLGASRLIAAFLQVPASGIGYMQANPLFTATSTASPGNAAKGGGYSVGVGPLPYRDAPRDAPADAWPDASSMSPAWLPAYHVQNCLYESGQGPASAIVFDGIVGAGTAGAATPLDVWLDASAMSPAWLSAYHIQNCLYESRQGPTSTTVFGAAIGGAASAATPGNRSRILSDFTPDENVYYSDLNHAPLGRRLENWPAMYEA